MSGYEGKFAAKIQLMSAAHMQLQISTESFVRAVQIILRDLSYKLTRVRHAVSHLTTTVRVQAGDRQH